MDSSQPTRGVNPECDILRLAFEVGGGVFPLVGKYGCLVWARCFGIEADTFKDWIVKYNIPHFPIGNEKVVDAVDFWKSVPFKIFASPKKPKPE